MWYFKGRRKKYKSPYTGKEVDAAVKKAEDTTATAAEIDAAVGYANKLSAVTEEWDGRNAIIANGGNIEPQQLFVFGIDITQLPTVTTEVTPNELTQAIIEGKKISYSLYGFEVEDAGFTFIEDEDVYCPNPIIIHNASIYSGGVLVLSFLFSSDHDVAFRLELHTIDYNNNDGTLYEHNILIKNSLTGAGGCLTIINTNSAAFTLINELGDWLYSHGYDSDNHLYPIMSDWINDTISSVVSCGIYANSFYEVYIHNAGFNKDLDGNNKIVAISSHQLANSITDVVTTLY